MIDYKNVRKNLDKMLDESETPTERRLIRVVRKMAGHMEGIEGCLSQAEEILEKITDET